MSVPQQPPGVPPGGAPQPGAPSRKPLIAALVVLGVLVAAGLGWYALRGGSAPAPVVTPTPPVAQAPAAPAQPEATQPPTERLPALGQSDARVRELVGALSSAPELQKWLAAEDLVRRFTTAAGNIAEGESPRAALSFMAPPGAFQVVEREGRTVIAPESFARYDAVARVVSSLDAQASARVYRTLKPLIDEAYKEISRPGQRFDQTLARSIQKLLDTPIPEGDLEVVDTPGVNYTYAAPELEQLSAAQKHLLRLGPTNARAVQTKLRELQSALALPTASR